MPYNPNSHVSPLALHRAAGTQLADLPFVDMRFTMPPAELRRHVAALIAQGLYGAKLPWLPGEKIVAGDLEGVANFVIGGLLGMRAEESGNNGSSN